MQFTKNSPKILNAFKMYFTSTNLPAGQGQFVLHLSAFEGGITCLALTGWGSPWIYTGCVCATGYNMTEFMLIKTKNTLMIRCREDAVGIETLNMVRHKVMINIKYVTLWHVVMFKMILILWIPARLSIPVVRQSHAGTAIGGLCRTPNDGPDTQCIQG